jgi:NAD(P)-dependent dehydrogenase (short-subunit alcohol dehydrogenase family)
MSLLAGKTVLITGGARHMGKAIALAMAREGARIAFTYLNSPDAAHKTLEQINAVSSDSIAVRCDVRDTRSITAAMAEVLAKFPTIDVLVNNAGYYESVPIEEITEKQWDNMFGTNVRGPFFVAQACIPALRASKGRIINIGSLGGEKAWPTHAHYCSSKASLHMLSQIMARSLAPEIAVNCIAPGMIVHGNNSDEAGARHFAEKTPMKRNGTDDDIVSAALYFATAPHFLTGQVLTVDGGLGLT